MLITCPSTAERAAEVAWERCFAAEVLCKEFPPATHIATRFIDSHFPLIKFAKQSPRLPPPLSVMPCLQVTWPSKMYADWNKSVWAALTDHGITRADPAIRVIQKGSPAAVSVRYIGPQLRRACMLKHNTPDAQFLRDSFYAFVFGETCLPIVNSKRRFSMWSKPINQLYELYGTRLKSVDIKEHIARLTELISSQDLVLLRALKSVYSRPLMGLLSLRLLRRALGAQTPLSKIYEGFTFCAQNMPQLFNLFQNDNLPSAKRLKTILSTMEKSKQQQLSCILSSFNSPKLYLSAMALSTEGRLYSNLTTDTFVVFCVTCGLWRSHALTNAKGTLMHIDLDKCEVTCARCNKNKLCRVKVNGNILRLGENQWARICGGCGEIHTTSRLFRGGALCKKCYKEKTTQKVIYFTQLPT